MLEKFYDPSSVEERQYRRWEEAGAFACDPGSVADPYAIVIPPPNVTGNLHIGHALNNTIQDILIRYHRMQGRDVLWQPGTDHAGIATQMVVERQLAEQGIGLDRGMNREADKNQKLITRDAFIDKVWQWREQSGGIILKQLRRLGASCDWDRERFTMDEGLSHAVLKVFVDLHRKGLIYKDKRLVNWDPKLHTAISDLEVEQRDVRGHLWHFKYPIEGQEETFITVATTRPETMLGDTAVAVHPKDKRYKKLIGKHAILPLVGRRIPIIADEYADPEQGSGAVKITPAHDFNDFEVGKRHALPAINVFDAEARISIETKLDFWENTAFSDRFGGPDELRHEIGGFPGESDKYERYQVDDPDLDKLRNLGGLDRFDARKKIVGLLETAGFLEKIEKHEHVIPHGDRSGVPIEPWLTDQWYVDAATLAKPAIEAVEQGKTNFVPKHWENTYFEWMRNIQPWCISRQLWWGHQIPVWYGPDGGVFCELNEEAAMASAMSHYGRPVEVVEKKDFRLKVLLGSVWTDDGTRFEDSPVPVYRDPDVLDTWFSSALWPFSTLGWPSETPEVARYYPTSVVVTGFDIIFFWVARMMMMGIEFMGEVPFADIYIHALVRDERGQKMSKSKGNVLDPLDLVDQFSGDAVRFTLAALAAQGRDIKLATSRIQGYRNFTTKLWNAARYVEMNECALPAFFAPENNLQTVNRWIVDRLARVAGEVEGAVESYRFNEAAGALYQFVWHEYCDWYLEITKPILQDGDEEAQTETKATLVWVLHGLLHLLHPFMPFITEELWERLGPEDAQLLIVDDWPVVYEGLLDEEAASEIDWVIKVISEIRSVRAEMNVPPKALLNLGVRDAGDATKARLETHRGVLLRLARLEEIELSETLPQGAVQSVIDEATFILPLAGIVDLKQESARLQKEIDKLSGEIDKFEKKLANEKFVANAPPAVVDEQKERREDAAAARSKLTSALARIDAA